MASLAIRRLVFGFGLAVASPPAAEAADLFEMTVEAGGASGTGGFGSVSALEKALDTQGYRGINPSYSATAPANIGLLLRGLPASIDYPTRGSRLVFRVPLIGERVAFNEGTRAASEDALIDFLEANEDDLLTRILQALAATSPVDPVAGNPNSLMSRMAAADFGAGSNIGAMTRVRDGRTGEEEEGAPGLAGLGLRFGRYSAGDFDSNVVDLPLNYVQPLSDPRWAVILDAPLTYVETEGSHTYAGSLGVGLRAPVYDDWTLTPMLRVGGAGSPDLGSGAVVLGGSVTSSYEFEVAGVNAVLGNALTYLTTLPVDVGSADYDYDLSNVVLRNGLGVSGGLDYALFDQPTTWEVSVVNTQFFGDELFVENYTDLAVSFGTESSRNGMTWDSLRIGLTYTFSDADYSGLRLNFGYRF